MSSRGGGFMDDEDDDEGEGDVLNSFDAYAFTRKLREAGDLYTGGGKSKSLMGSHNVAIAHFNLMADMLSESGDTIPHFEDAPPELFCDETIYERFIFYLKNEAYKKILNDKRALEEAGEDLSSLFVFTNSEDTQEPLLLSTIKQYFSNFLQVCIKFTFSLLCLPWLKDFCLYHNPFSGKSAFGRTGVLRKYIG